MKSSVKKTSRPPALYRRIKQILTAAQTGVARTVNTTQVVANWLIGREIVEESSTGPGAPRMAGGCWRNCHGN